MKGSVIAFGTDSGGLYVYGGLRDWNDLNLLRTISPSFAETCFDQPVTSIDIGEDDEGPIVVASASDKFIRVRWIPDGDQDIAHDTRDDKRVGGLVDTFNAVSLV